MRPRLDLPLAAGSRLAYCLWPWVLETDRGHRAEVAAPVHSLENGEVTRLVLTVTSGSDRMLKAYPAQLFFFVPVFVFVCVVVFLL